MEATVAQVVSPIASCESPPWGQLERAVERLVCERCALDEMRRFRRVLAVGTSVAAAMLAPVSFLASPLSEELLVAVLVWIGILLASRASILSQLDRQTAHLHARTRICTTQVQRLLAGSGESCASTSTA